MPKDWYVASIDEIQSSAAALHTAVDRTLEALLIARRERVAGVSLIDIFEGLIGRSGTDVRRSGQAAFQSYAEAITAYRARTIRALVDDEGFTFAEIARRTDVSRQMVSRLYHRAKDR